MGKRGKKKLPSVDDLLERPWCYYCERDFDDLKILLSHQKAKHFKCNKCGRRLNTAGGLSVHLNQVHKESLTLVENALPNRQGLEVEIFGMEGVPEDATEQHRLRVVQNYYEAQAAHTRATGNPPRGSGQQHVPKKPKLEDEESLRKRLEAWKARKAGMQPDADTVMTNAPFGGPAVPFQFSQQPPQPGFAPPGAAPFQPPPAFIAGSPPATGTPFGLPPRPPVEDSELTASVDNLISEAKALASAREGEPPAPPADKADKRVKKDKKENQRLVYSDNEISPEEKMARNPRYAFTRSGSSETVLASATGEAGAAVTGPVTEDLPMQG